MSPPRPDYWLVILLVVLVVFIGGVAWWIQSELCPTPSPEVLGPVSWEEGQEATTVSWNDPASGTGSAANQERPPQVSVWPGAAEQARRLHASDGTAEEDLQILQDLLGLFRRANHGINPAAGLNEEFVDALRGKNEAHLAVLPPELPSINSAGQIVDRWGTPYYFHPVSREVVEIRSAGLDRKLWTADDVTDASEE